MAQTTQHDEHLLQAAFMQLGLDKSAPRDVPTVNPLLTNTLAAIPSAPEILDTPDMPPAIPLEASSPAPAPSLPASPDTLACDSGYESNSPRPAPRTTTRGKLADKRATRRHAPYPRSPSLASSPGGSPSSISSLPSPGSGTPELKVSRRRNIQLPALPSSPSSPSASGPDSSSIAGRWCQGCEKTFPRMNKAEFNRHVKSHTGEANKCDWVCTGVPIELACEVYKLSVDRIQQLEAEGRAMWWNGRYMVGGCRTSVSRRDALKRHLRLSQGNCVGDQNGDWQIGNAKK
ncbi:hypothetical protein L227DRAFT_577130 [Lentinus tigrinus ALCF2SS1-6]|uniref:Uncharacterized protein n=1 Tax=Lentinus tigrinus ALCF2SS1-6 TaxID=1328759 RepID=A0A5C2SAT1_9APHY|nr:hypothetical protein L227DRAFT_577130 [Lentinus tigrinus ALCF2SS1-6]